MLQTATRQNLCILLLGPPGCGKGTQAKLLCKRFNIPQVSTGDMLRAAIAENSKLGRRTQEIVNHGGLVPDEIMTALVRERIQKDDCKGGFLLDGFPRTVQQARALDRTSLAMSHVFIFQLEDEEAVKRITGRRVHPASGRSYHLVSKPPRSPGLDDLTGEPLIQRKDDSAELAQKRLELYRRQTAPLVDFYKHKNQTTGQPHCLVLDGAAKIEALHQRITREIDGAVQRFLNTTPHA